ncbi:hypothetical protein TeGR_g12405, partial [Tetraparma gracilis]
MSASPDLSALPTLPLSLGTRLLSSAPPLAFHPGGDVTLAGEGLYAAPRAGQPAGQPAQLTDCGDRGAVLAAPSDTPAASLLSLVPSGASGASGGSGYELRGPGVPPAAAGLPPLVAPSALRAAPGGRGWLLACAVPDLLVGSGASRSVLALPATGRVLAAEFLPPAPGGAGAAAAAPPPVLAVTSCGGVFLDELPLRSPPAPAEPYKQAAVLPATGSSPLAVLLLSLSGGLLSLAFPRAPTRELPCPPDARAVPLPEPCLSIAAHQASFLALLPSLLLSLPPASPPSLSSPVPPSCTAVHAHPRAPGFYLRSPSRYLYCLP